MGIVKIAVGALLGLVLVSPRIDASGFENTAVGTSGQAMGGAFRAIADDWTAAYYNPAGLAFQKDNSFGAYASFTQLRNEVNPNFRYVDSYGNIYETGVINDQPINNFHQIYYTPGSGVVTRMPFGSSEIVLGLSAYQPFDHNITWQLFVPMYAYNDSAAGLYPTEQFKNNLDVVAFQLTAAKTSANEKFGFGIGLQLLRADLNYNDLLFRDNPLPEPVNVRPYEHIPQFMAANGSGWGFGVRAGMMYKFNKGTLALTAAMPFDITLKGSAAFNYLMPRNLSLSHSYVVGTPEYLFTTGASVKMAADFETKLNLPSSFAVAGSFRPTEKLTVALDVEMQVWSNFDGFRFDYTNATGLPIGGTSPAISSFFTAATVRPAAWKAAGKIAAGVKYDWIPKLSLLAGGSLDQSADPDNQSNLPQLTDTGDKLGLNLGGVLHASPRFNCSLVLSYRHYPNLNVTGFYDLNSDGISDSFPGNYKAETVESVLSFDYRF
jgi:long-chain fatty acid transport protein